MELPTISQIFLFIPRAAWRLVLSLGGIAKVAGLLLLLLLVNVANPLLAACRVSSTMKSRLWLRVLNEAFCRLLKITATAWETLLEVVRFYDQRAKEAETKFNLADAALIGHGIPSPEWRKRLIQAAVLQVRIEDLLHLWEALGRPPMVPPPTPPQASVPVAP